jgi:hypothetical protein
MEDRAAQAEALPPGFFDQPVLVVDPGRHTAPIRRAAAIDRAGRRRGGSGRRNPRLG